MLIGNDKEIKKYALFLIDALIVLLGATNEKMTYAAVVVAFVIAALIGMYLNKYPGAWVCEGIVFLLCVQNLCIGIGAHAAGNTDDNLKLLTQIPFITIFVVWVSVSISQIIKDGFRKYIKNKTNILFALLMVCIAMSLLAGHGNISSCLVSLRNMTVFYMVYIIGQHAIRNRDDMQLLIRFILIAAMAMCIIGFVFMLGGYDLYKAFGVHEVYIAKASPFTEGRLDDRFIRVIRGRIVTRMGSIYYEPVNLAYFFAISVLCSVFHNPFDNKPVKAGSVILSVTGLALTIGKGGYVIVVMSVCCLIGEYIIRKFFRIDYKRCSDSLLLFFMILLALIGVTLVIILFITFSDDRELVLPHIRGITGAMNSIAVKPLGYGLGNGGNAAYMFYEGKMEAAAWQEMGGETALMSFMYQIGVHGVIVFMMCVVSTGLKKVKQMDTFEKILFCMPWTLLCVSLLQDNTFTPQCITPYMLLLGGIRNIGSETGK